MKKIYTILSLSLTLLLATSCEDIVEGINDNPNDIIVSDVEERLFLTGGMIANVQVQLGHLNRISGMYSGQLIGYSSLYSNIYGFNLSTAESNGEWNAIYVGVITNMRHIIENSNSQLLTKIKISLNNENNSFNKYKIFCSSCHEKGNFGAPQRGNIESWQKYEHNSLEDLVLLALKGEGSMLAKSGCTECSLNDFQEIIKIMLPMNWNKTYSN